MLRTNVYDTNKVLFTFEVMLQTTICVTTKLQFTFENNTDTFYPYAHRKVGLNDNDSYHENNYL